jgi:rod shape-determining protein MreB
MGGNIMDEAILQFVKQKYNLLIGDSSAELIKKTVGSALQTDEVDRMKVKGRDLVSGIPQTIEVDSTEVNESIREQVETIVQTIKTALEQTPPELAGDIVERGMVLTGGGAFLKNLDQLLFEETGLPITIAEDPLSSVAIGSGKTLESIDILRQVMI